MTHRQIQPSEVIGRTLVRNVQTPWTGPVVHYEGLGEAMYATVGFCLDNGVAFSTVERELVPLEDMPEQPDRDAHVSVEAGVTYLGRKITALLYGRGDGSMDWQIFLILEKGVSVADYHSMANGNWVMACPVENLSGMGPFYDLSTGEPYDV
jgi:hypothetical protein